MESAGADRRTLLVDRLMARVLLIRHCRTDGKLAESPLTDVGHAQAKQLATWLAGRDIDRIVSSPAERALDTVRPFATAAGLEIELDARLVERRMPRYPSYETFLDGVRAAMEDRALRPDGGETGLEVTARAWPALLEALDGANAVTVLASHGQLAAHLLREIDGTSGYALWRAMTMPDVYDIRRDDARIDATRFSLPA